MPKNRVVLTFSATPGGPFSSYAGWSETLWNNQDVSPETLLVALTGAPNQPPTNPYIADRRALLTPGWRVDGVKVYPITGGRIASAVTLTGNTGAGLYPMAPNELQEQPYDRLLWRMNAAGGKSRSCRLGGISSDIVDAGGNYTAANLQGIVNPQQDPFNVSVYTVFIPHLITNQFGMRLSTVGQPISIIDVITDPDVAAGASGRTPVITFDGNQVAVFQPLQVIRISNAQQPARMNGQWTVDTAQVFNNLTRVKLRAKQNLVIDGHYNGGAYARTISYSVVPMVAGNPVRGVSRKPGRPSGLPRGRRSRRTV